MMWDRSPAAQARDRAFLHGTWLSPPQIAAIRRLPMSGMITRRHAWTCPLTVLLHFGGRAWLRLAFGHYPTALAALVHP